MAQFVNTFQEKYVDWLKAIVEHLQLTLLSLIISVIIAIPIGILISKRKGISHICLQATGVLQTIPSLALLGLFIPFMGIGILPAMSALIIYALFPILQATITGIHMIDPVLEEASTAFGMNRWEKLKKFEIPLALPVIMDGVRTAGVMIIGTATLAALVGAGGLGSFILLGIDRNNGSLIMIGAISSAMLAILFNFLLKILERLKLKMILISFLVLIVGLGSSFMPNLLSSQYNRTLTIAGKIGPEPEILINMYKLLIEDSSDISVKIKPNFGKTDFLYEALKSGDIDIYPEFTGTITSTLLKNSPKLSNDPNIVFKAARDDIYKQDKLTLLAPMAYQNTFAIATKTKFAKENDLSTISDLKKIEKRIKAGFTIEFNDREDGNRGLKNLYGLNLSVVTMEPSLRYKAIDKDDIQLMEVYSTDPEIIKYDLKVLKDDKQLFPPYQGAPLLRSGLLKEYPEIQNILNKLGNKISDAEMSGMNYEVGIEGKSAYKVAKTYLEKKGLLSN